MNTAAFRRRSFIEDNSNGNFDTIEASEKNGLFQNYTYNSIGNILRVFDGVNTLNYSYGAGAGPHAVSSTFGYSNISYGYESYSVTSSCTGVSPAQGSNWTITSNTSCVGGRVRLDTNKSVTVTANKSLYMDNANLEANQYPGVFVWLEPGSVLELGSASTAYINDAPSASYPGNLTTQYLYDLNGNMVNDSRYVYEYNEDSRLKRVLNQSGALKEEYVYDHGGSRKVKLTVLSASLNKTTLYMARDWLVEEYTNGTVENILYIYVNEEMLTRLQGGSKYYYHPDHLGSTVVVTKQDGSLQERIQYEPYGLPRETSKELYQFTNQEWSGDLGIYDYGARQYNPVLKKFMQADTVIKDYYDPQGLNRYTYVSNNPLKYTDPTGHDNYYLGTTGNFGWGIPLINTGFLSDTKSLPNSGRSASVGGVVGYSKQEGLTLGLYLGKSEGFGLLGASSGVEFGKDTGLGIKDFSGQSNSMETGFDVPTKLSNPFLQAGISVKNGESTVNDGDCSREVSSQGGTATVGTGIPVTYSVTTDDTVVFTLENFRLDSNSWLGFTVDRVIYYGDYQMKNGKGYETVTSKTDNKKERYSSPQNKHKG